MKKKSKKLLPILILIIVGVIILTSLVIYNRSTIVGTKIHTDTDNKFSVKIPGNWKESETNATNRTGIGTAGEKTQKIEISQLYDPATQIGITVQVYEGAPSCVDVKKPTTTLAGLPATYDSTLRLWTIPTKDATYVVNYYFPGISVFHAPKRFIFPSSVPQKEFEANQMQMEALLKSFVFKNAQPLLCP